MLLSTPFFPSVMPLYSSHTSSPSAPYGSEGSTETRYLRVAGLLALGEVSSTISRLSFSSWRSSSPFGRHTSLLEMPALRQTSIGLWLCWRSLAFWPSVTISLVESKSIPPLSALLRPSRWRYLEDFGTLVQLHFVRATKQPAGRDPSFSILAFHHRVPPNLKLIAAIELQL